MNICNFIINFRTSDKFKKNFCLILLNFNKGALFSINTILILDNNFAKFQDKTYTIKKKNNKNEIKEIIDEIKQFLTKTVNI